MMEMQRQKRRVLVAMSGGVDSSVAVLLLQQQGFEIIGATLNNWSYEGRQEPYNECCSLEVRTVAQQLGIEHHWIDAGAAFKQQVVDPFLSDYAGGRTPSPCQRCNRFIRFPALLAWAERLGCDYLATGHHARITQEKGVFYLLKGRDALKDQSYYLFGLGQRELRRLLLPIGEYEKHQIWQIARENNLVSARKPESMDLCFIPNGDRLAYLRGHLNGQMEPGEIVTPAGELIGRHEGLAAYTVGQRRGLGLSLGRPAYVIALDRPRNRVVVGSLEDLLATGLIATDVSFVYLGELNESLSVEVKIRYQSLPVPAQISPRPDGKISVEFAAPQRAVAPGQTIVFYQGERVVGGGTIESRVSLTVNRR
jgi:tRNA-specific 2-thiouridylase